MSTGTSNKKHAQVKLDDIKVKLFKGEIGAKPSAGKRVPIPDYFRRYINFIKAGSPVDRHSDLSRIRTMQEFFARKKTRYINSITPALVDEFTSTVLANKKPKTVKNFITLLKTMMNKAVEWDLIDLNPIAKVKPPKIVKTFNFFRREEIDRLIAEAQEPLKTVIIILYNTGIRRGELFHLRWRDVDLDANNLRIWPYEGYSPKGKRPRKIPISKKLNPILKKLSKGKKPDDYVLRPFKNVESLHKPFAAHVKRLGMKGSLHDLRHTFASHLAMVGVPIPVIKELLGHSDITTTMIYAHLSPDTYQAAVDKLHF